MNDLIERLQLVKDIFDGHAEGDLHPYLEQSDAIGEAITALSTPTIEEVQFRIRTLRVYGDDAAADLIERLGRAYAGVRGDMKQASKIISEQEQRIKELEARNKTLNDGLELLKAHPSYERAVLAEQQQDEMSKVCRELLKRNCPEAMPAWAVEHARIRAMGDE